MKIAVIGAGISGLVCAYLLAGRHEVVLYEKEARLGGHTHTIVIPHEGRSLPVDTGFIVFNDRNYPNFCKLLDRLGVAWRSTTMSFSVRDDASDFEYGGSSVAGVVGSWSNLIRPRWWSVVSGVVTLNRKGKSLLAAAEAGVTIGDLYRTGSFSRGFLDSYLVPMAASIWSAPREVLLDFPAAFLLRFFDNHGMLNLRERPRWRTIEGGSKTYIDAMLGVIAGSARTEHGVTAVKRLPDGVVVQANGAADRFDEVVLAAHSDQSLRMLADAGESEREILGAMPYQPNDVVLHTDERLLPRRRRCWAAWNYRLGADAAHPATVTYNMTMLQGLGTRTPLCVTLNDTERIDHAKVLARFTYDHPIYSVAGERARARWGEISGVNRTHYCGAYWGNGFHEDGVVSALRVCERLGVGL